MAHRSREDDTRDPRKRPRLEQRESDPRSGDPREHRGGDPREYRGDPREHREYRGGDPREYRGGDPREYRGDPREYRGEPRGEPRYGRGGPPERYGEERGEYRGDRGGRGRGDRGGRGRGGRGESVPIEKEGTIVTNHYPFLLPDAPIYQYTIDWGTDATQKKYLRKKIYAVLLKRLYGNQEIIFQECVFDGTTIYSIHKDLFKVGEEKFSEDVTVNKEIPVELDKATYIIRFSRRRTIDLRTSPDAQSIPNIILKRALVKCFKQYGRNLYDDTRPFDLSSFQVLQRNVKIIPGYFTEISCKKFRTGDQFVLTVDCISKVLSLPTILEIVLEKYSVKEFTEPKVQDMLRREWIGKYVTPRYAPDRPYPIIDLDFSINADHKFKCIPYWRKDHEKKEIDISLADYLYSRYNYKINEYDQFVIVSESKTIGQIHLLPEACNTRDIPTSTRGLLPQVCSIKPQDRVREITNLIQMLSRPTTESGKKAKDMLGRWGMGIKPEPIASVMKRFPARPRLFGPFGSSHREGIELDDSHYTSQNGFGATLTAAIMWDNSVPKQRWKLIISIDLVADDMTQYFIKLVEQMINQMLERNAPITIADTDFKRIRVTDKDRCDHVQCLSNTNWFKSPEWSNYPRILWIAFLAHRDPSVNAENYRRIKKFTTTRGIFSQCISAETQGPKKSKLWDNKMKGKDGINIKSVIPNIWHQIINKTGELCWWTYLENYIPVLAKKCVMIIGIDVHHAKLSNKAKKEQAGSLGAIVIVLVLPDGQWRTYCGVVELKARMETLGKKTKDSVPQPEQIKDKRPVELGGPEVAPSQPIQNVIITAMKEYKATPDVVIVYRDGVSNSQLADTKEFEVKQILNACPKSKVIFSVIQKQNHSRFMVQPRDRPMGNPPPGSYFDDARIMNPSTILQGDFADFYLIPTYNGTSTAKPVHYCIIQGVNIVPLEQFQFLTFVLCHLYPNWASSIRVPFVTQAAHKLAFLLGEVQNPEIHSNLAKSFFYL